MMSKEEMIERLEKARSWKEAGITPQDVYELLVIDNLQGSQGNPYEAELEELRAKYDRIAEINKQLRAENKSLRAKK